MRIETGGDERAWLLPAARLREMLDEFLDVYANRPVSDNAGGVNAVGAFSLWYFLKRQQPALVIESGVWKGQTTWLIEVALPAAEIVCFDPNRSIRQYASPKAMYPRGDFAAYRLSGIAAGGQILAFFDDHQDAVKRVVQARKKGIRHLVFDDNYPVGAGGHRSLAHALAQGGAAARYLEAVIEQYQVFPPLFAYEQPVTAERARIGIAPLDLPGLPSSRLPYKDMSAYRWMTYARLRTGLRLSPGMRWFELRNGRL